MYSNQKQKPTRGKSSQTLNNIRNSHLHNTYDGGHWSSNRSFEIYTYEQVRHAVGERGKWQ